MNDLSPYLPRILQHDGICRLSGKKLYITDRRVLPLCEREVAVSSVREAAKALTDMVTQGGAPLEVSLWALVLAARLGMKDEQTLSSVIQELSSSRKTNTTMARTLLRMHPFLSAHLHDSDFPDYTEALVISELAAFDRIYEAIGRAGATLIGQGDGILTTCFAEHSLFLSLAFAKAEGKEFTLYVPETRPYLQGARLTAPAAVEMGYRTCLITDGMGAHYMKEGRIQLYLTASDLYLADGTIVNKVGTLANAIAARYYGIPYYACSMGMDRNRKGKDIHAEERDGDEVRQVNGQRIVGADIPALYPCFDIIEPGLVSGVVTAEGICRYAMQ